MATVLMAVPVCGTRDVCGDDDINCVFHTQTGR